MASSSLYCSTGSGAQWPGAIIGDIPNPFGAALLSAGQFFTTGDLDLGGDGEVSGLTVFTVETWFRADAIPGGNENIASGPMTTTGVASREWVLTLNLTGQISFAARTTTPTTITATGATVIRTGIYYHLVGRVDGTNIKIFVNGVEDGSTAWGGASVQNRGTTAGSMDTVVGCPTGTQTYYFDEFAIYRSSLGSDRILAHYQAGVQRGFKRQLPLERITEALDSISSHAPRKLIGPTTRRMQAEFYAGTTALDEVQNARLAENVDATVFVSKSGEVSFLDAAHRSSAPYNTTQVTLGDAGGAEIPYEDLGVDFADDTIANEWTVTRTNGVAQVVSDATSQATNGYRPQSITGLPLTDDSDALNIANGMLAKYKDPVERSNSVALNAELASVAEVAFDRDLGDRIRILRTPPAGGTRIDQTVFIHSIDISGTPAGPWDVTWGVSPL